MNILIIGSGGREHAIAKVLSKSSNLDQLYICPGNAGTAQLGTNLSIDVSDFLGLKEVIKDKQVEMVVVGPEQPLVDGIVDFFSQQNDLKDLLVLGPDKRAAQLEGSKKFAKEFMVANGIPTAAYKTFSTEELEEAKAYLHTRSEGPIVVKADGLAAGKGVVVATKIEEAIDALDQIMEKKAFGDAGNEVVIEEFLQGVELSVFVLTDGKNYLVLPEAKDYKRIGEGDQGPNTGGMGAISPVAFADKKFMDLVDSTIIRPTIEGIKKEKFNYKGFIFIGLMNVGGHPYVIEYNVRLGDPETQAILPRIDTDFVKLFKACCKGDLASVNINIKDVYSALVVLASKGYPASYPKGELISIDSKLEDDFVFHAGSSLKSGNLTTSGGRVMSILGQDTNLSDAISKAYNAVDLVDWKSKVFRRDIGQDLLRIEESV